MLRISQIKLNPEEPVSLLPKKIGQKLRIEEIFSRRTGRLRQTAPSMPGSKTSHSFFDLIPWILMSMMGRSYCEGIFLRGVSLTKAPDHTYRVPDLSSLSLSEEERPVIAGFGPCGMFAALILAEAGLRPVVLERGRDVDRRAQDVEHFWNTGELDTESNVQFGEGRRRYFFRRKADDGN